MRVWREVTVPEVFARFDTVMQAFSKDECLAIDSQKGIVEVMGRLNRMDSQGGKSTSALWVEVDNPRGGGEDLPHQGARERRCQKEREGPVQVRGRLEGYC